MCVSYDLLCGGTVTAFNDYYEATREAARQGLKLAEYGDCYGSEISYCYYNESGDRYDDEKIICYYVFVKGKPAPLNEEEFIRYLFY